VGLLSEAMSFHPPTHLDL